MATDTKYSQDLDFDCYVSVLLDLAVDKTFDYGVPPDKKHSICKGVRVAVPVRGKRQEGYVIAVKEKSSFPKVKAIQEILSDGELITPSLFDLALWIAQYYCAPLRQVFKSILPATVRKAYKPQQQLYVMRKKSREELRERCVLLRGRFPAQAAILDQMLQVKSRILLSELMEKCRCSRSPIDTLAKQGDIALELLHYDRSPLEDAEFFITKPKILSAEQDLCLREIIKTLETKSYATHLIHGITGSGKTEIYLQAIDHALSQGRHAIVLVPEIALTTQMIERFRSRFEGKIGILHHRLSDGERHDEWHRIKRGEAPIVIGARSAIFSPQPNLGLIIVDEEHESSYKQDEESPCYNARDVAIMRGAKEHCAVILGSATPSLESYNNAETGKYQLHSLKNRPSESAMPAVTIVDMRKEDDKAKRWTNFSELLLHGIAKRTAKGEQTILFLNRRGYHTTVLCPQCGKSCDCPHCDTSLTFHKKAEQLRCHLCGYQIPPPRGCSSCGHETIKFQGAGTEQIEKALHAILPEVRTLRLDADTTKHKGSHQELLKAFKTGKADLLIGTQMIAKGLHFPEVTLVGIINIDGALHLPDFRASEQVFQLIMQVGGRSGRGSARGEVILQTRIPDNAMILHAANHDYISFYREEKVLRELFHYPPFCHMTKVRFEGEDLDALLRYAHEMHALAVSVLPVDHEIMPLIPSGHAKIKNRYRYQFLIKGKASQVRKWWEIVEKTGNKPKNIKMIIDIDPTATFF